MKRTSALVASLCGLAALLSLNARAAEVPAESKDDTAVSQDHSMKK